MAPLIIAGHGQTCRPCKVAERIRSRARQEFNGGPGLLDGVAGKARFGAVVQVAQGMEEGKVTPSGAPQEMKEMKSDPGNPEDASEQAADEPVPMETDAQPELTPGRDLQRLLQPVHV
jgi:hypothetical protein